AALPICVQAGHGPNSRVARSWRAQRRLLPRPRRDADVRRPGMDDRRIVCPGVGARPLPGAACDREFVRAHRGRPPRAARRCRQLARAGRQPGPAVKGSPSSRFGGAPFARFKDEPQRFSFDSAVRLLTFLRRRADPAVAARFTSATGSSYLPAEVTQVQVDAGIAEPLVTVGLIGLTGPVGVLARYYSDAVVADQRSRAFSLTRFLDLISHRMVAGFAAAGTKYRPHRAADVGALGASPERGDPVAEVLLSLTGYATPHLAERLLAGPAALRHYAGFFSAHPRSADRLEAFASDWLGRTGQGAP